MGYINIRYTGTSNTSFTYNGVTLWSAAPGDCLTVPDSDLWMYLPPNNTGPVNVTAYNPSGSWINVVNDIAYNGSMEPVIHSTGVSDFVNEVWTYPAGSQMYAFLKWLQVVPGGTGFSNLPGLLNNLRQNSQLVPGYAPH